MHDLRVIGVENSVLLASANDGTRYRIPIDDETHSLLRRRSPVTRREPRVAPRDIQSHIRAGMSAEEVAELTGAELEHIQKFEGPVLAERQFVVTAALAVPVNTATDSDPLNGSTFGTVMDDRLADLGASAIAWGSWKDPEAGWIVKLSFTARDVEHDARWQFDPKKAALAPLNGDATRLSQQGEVAGALIPRLRAVPAETSPDTTRFDSGAFTAAELGARDTAPYADAIPFGRGGQSVSPAAINSDPAEGAESGNTADLLEALRRRRGEREAAPTVESEEPRSAHPATSSIRVIDIPLDDFDDDVQTDDAPGARSHDSGQSTTRDFGRHSPGTGGQRSSAQASSSPGVAPATPASRASRKGRVSMPSWDDIVFGAKADDD